MKGIGAMRSNATDAYNELCRLAETDREEGLLPGKVIGKVVGKTA